MPAFVRVLVLLGALHLAQGTTTFKNCSVGSVVSVVSSAAPNVLQVWLTLEVPSLLFATYNQSIVPPNWDRLVNCSNSSQGFVNDTMLVLSSLGAPLYQYGTLIPSLYEFDDSQGSALYQPGMPFVEYSLSGLNHSLVLSSVDISGSSAQFTTGDGVVQLSLQAHTDTGRDAINPYLAYTPQSLSLSLVISNFNYTFPNGKPAANLIFWSMTSEVTQSTEQSIDDEYTPTVFSRTQVVADNQAYTYWKPVAFGSSDRTPDNDTFATSNDLRVGGAISPIPLGPARPVPPMALHTVTVSFGEPKDDAYQFSYIAWSFSVGLGAVPDETLSSTLLLTIIITNGLPALAFLFGGAYLGYKKLRGNQPKYSIQ